jgi:hypothetical protein
MQNMSSESIGLYIRRRARHHPAGMLLECPVSAFVIIMLQLVHQCYIGDLDSLALIVS